MIDNAFCLHAKYIISSTPPDEIYGIYIAFCCRMEVIYTYFPLNIIFFNIYKVLRDVIILS